MTPTTPLIEFKGVTKRFGKLTVLDHVDLTIYEGETTTLIGKSGSGKSVLLKHVIGLLEPDEGEILFRGKSARAMTRQERKAVKREISYMFQNNALFDSLTVYENIALPLKEKTKLSEAAIREKIVDKMAQLDLREINDKYPSQISGGMQKRVALARALITDPKIVLFDEPTTGLDPLRKNAVLGMIAHYQKKFGFTAIVVSHDIPDVFFISNRVAIIDNRRVIFQGSPMELEQSQNDVVQQFIKGQLSLRDELTGLATKRDIEERLQAEINRVNRFQETFSVILFTIDHLEQIDEHVGYIAAQRITQCLASLLRDHFGTSGISARYSRNGILTVLPHTGYKEAERLLDELGAELRTREILQAQTYPTMCLNFSIRAGIAEAKPNDNLQSLAKEAASAERIIAQLECGKRGETT